MKFYESGRMDNVMPTGHMAHALPRENFQAKPAPQSSATVPVNHMAKVNAIIQALRQKP